MRISNRILLSSVVAALLLANSPVSLIAAEVGAIYEDGTSNITVVAGDTITLDDTSLTLNGIELDPSIDVGVSILNEGAITIDSTAGGDTYGIYSFENFGYVNNGGVIDVNTDIGYAEGIYILFNQADAIITNESTGTIFATSIDNEAGGIYITDNAGIVENYGGIEALSDSSDAFGIFVETSQPDTAEAAVINKSTGTISATSVSGTATGMAVIDNTDGIVENYGSIEASSDDASVFGIATLNNVSDSADAIIANKSTGTISVTSTNGDASGMFVVGNVVAALNLSTIENSGSIEASSENGDAFGIYGLENQGSITNSGTIISESTNGDAFGIFVDNNDGKITNSGTITAPTAVYIGTGNGSLNNISGGIINGDIQMQSINVQNDGTINLASITDISTVNDFTQSSSGVLGIILNSGADGIAQYSKLSANGTVTLNAGTTLNVNVQTLTDYQDLLTGQQLADVISATTLTADASTLNVTDTSALLNFVPVVDGSTLDLDIVEGVSIVDATQNTGVVGAYDAASVLDGYTGDDADLTSFISSLNTLETQEEVAQAILETTPTTTTALSNLSTEFYSNIGSIVESTQDSSTGMNSGDIVLGDKNLWIKPFGAYSKQNDRDGLNGFSAHSKGVGIGIDGEYEKNQRIGLAAFYTQADVDTNGVNQNTKLDIFNLIVYGNFPVIDNSTKILYQLGMGIQQTSSTRTITAPALTAKADYNAKTLMANIKLARQTAINNSFDLSSKLFGTYVYYKNPSYSESGAGGLNLSVQGFNTTSLIFGVEESLKYSIIDGTDLMLNIALGYDFGDTNQDVSANYHGASGATFTTNGIDNGPWSYKTGVEIAQELQNDITLSAGYNLDGRGSDFKNHTLFAKVNWKF